MHLNTRHALAVLVAVTATGSASAQTQRAFDISDIYRLETLRDAFAFSPDGSLLAS